MRSPILSWGQSRSNEPTTGEINYKNVFKLSGEGVLKASLVWNIGNSKPNKAGEDAVIKAYREVQ